MYIYIDVTRFYTIERRFTLANALFFSSLEKKWASAVHQITGMYDV